MKFVTMPDHNIRLGAPDGWDAEKHGECETITAKRDADGYTVAFKLEPHELERLLDGGKVVLKIFGAGFPPIAPWIE